MSHSPKGVWPSLTAVRAFNMGKNWGRSGLAFGAAGAVATCFFFEWKYVLKYVPFINSKWSDQK